MKPFAHRVEESVLRFVHCFNEAAGNRDEATALLAEMIHDMFPAATATVTLREHPAGPGDEHGSVHTGDAPHNDAGTYCISTIHGDWMLSFEKRPDAAEDRSMRLIAGYISALLALHNEQAMSNRLSTLLNSQIDRQHATNDALQNERAARAGFERELAATSRKITEAIVETQEMERRRFARDLHDGIGNTLAMVKLLVSSLGEEHTPQAERAETYERILRLLDTAVHESRQIAQSLTSEMLIEHGLIPTLKEMIARINSSASLRADLQVFGISHPLPKHIEQNLFRIIQELVNNILKHAQASEFSVQCIQHADSIIVMVEDDGVGLKQEGRAAQTTGMGLGNIRTRLDVLNGSMAVDSSPGRGTVITLEIPFPGRAPQRQPGMKHDG